MKKHENVFGLDDSKTKDYEPSLAKQQTEIEVGNDVNSLFKDIQGNKLGSIQEVIDDINDLIQKREMLNGEIFTDIEKIKMDINNFVLSLGDEMNKAEQLNMRQKQIEIDEVKINEKLNMWRDIALLKKELRERIRDIREQEGKETMLDSILED